MSDSSYDELDDAGVYAQLARLGKALSNPLRIRLLDLLEQGEHTVEELAVAARAPVKNTSAQLQQLRAVQLVATRREGVRIHYRLADPAVSGFLGSFERFAGERVAEMRSELEQLYAQPGGMERIGIAELERRMRDGQTVLVDVRPAEEFAKGHLPGAISMPLEDLRRRIDELPADAAVVAYCEGPYCFGSGHAVAMLAEAGHDAVRIDGGVASWVRAGRELDGVAG
ncbi:Transcriptional regulator ArsR family [Patulibacter medicamentivorans]|uniref:Transcriptional regulator ArsR family n=1 Tax=Patulibacter medicamentivorans TaxID=1097667 RepID=H0EBH6_9ACTN|nr:metalloregulator ArsR/SmtB family transcription factor [Patulibacter medicamentivorans]EHN08957.1 Transcriptional regulator ArsR family [Patulibacter medicamentivorans]